MAGLFNLLPLLQAYEQLLLAFRVIVRRIYTRRLSPPPAPLRPYQEMSFSNLFPYFRLFYVITCTFDTRH